MRYIWMRVTRDKYELPVAVADTAEELARIVGVNPHTIFKSRKKSGSRSIYKKVEIEEE